MTKDKKQIYKPKPVSGFPEWLPEERLVEQKWLDHIRRVFESYGYTNIETPAAEEINVLTAKGETDKEIYTLTRLQADESDTKEARIGLHFDQTVPLARYTAMHFNELDFPFKRYAMQKVWRGERPQLGRMREFYQCDIDVIHVDHLPLHFDAEMPAVIYEVFKGLDIGRIQIRISNRKILLGLLEALNINDVVPITRTVDKLDKLGKDEVSRLLVKECGLSEEQASCILELVTLQITTQSFDVLLHDFIARNDVIARSDSDAAIHTMQEGIEELSFILDQLSHLPEGAVVADLSIVRGLDYYTGTVYETRLLDIPEFTSSVCSGGRYDDLAGSYINKHLPGVGISIGFTRLFDVLRHNGYIKTDKKCPTDILVILPEEDMRTKAQDHAATLRKQGKNVEVYHAPQKIGKQIAYAEKKGIPYVYFPDLGEMKNLETGEQSEYNLNSR
jgi:histidyl-tRNA synthetase